MRNNLPVTQQEYLFDDNATLMSTTDTRSIITYANDAFIEASGFSPEEINGQPHNMVRHPDMPAEAFADMWATLKKGEPWSALVKNRRKNGDHYWVRANAIPVVRNGQVQGYMSVRTKPGQQEVRETAALYQKFREGKAKGVRFHKGLVVRTGLMRWRSLFKTQPLAVATGASQKVEQMDRVDEVGMTLRAIGQLGLMFRWLVDDVSGQAINVLSASDAIAQSNSELSRRTEQAAANVQQTAATMNEMTATVKNNTETAAEVNQLSISTSSAALQGGAAMNEMVSMMAEITDSSKKIASITSVIDGIAFQTNILALNAAVEAARAGEQGKGFAVVAGEVRSLAQRSAAAASEIKALVETSASNVQSGTRQVNDTGKTMESIVSQVQNVTTLITQISAATAEQATALSEVSLAVEDLDHITHQNAARVEESARASGRMNHQATRLVEAISVFR